MNEEDCSDLLTLEKLDFYEENISKNIDFAFEATTQNCTLSQILSQCDLPGRH